ncbi:MAG: outer membrane beta-barrel protein [Bacteroidetes bacterium]|jgi:hypothetical protein|nr:outer membrane beta-barrel protein [Bacteroidota bacterium]MBT4398444.1 outer membrane beta-barrel protein [Bacteroidota bacterium]MBT4408844.1 outer membrane beta-barrel protein [Bacteroidota bacterium]MBT7092430.1 outer membrane beta-barrel protein [Bacteroidota bacterium]MBT7464797.1 outer membrane beta-barrel protein [Bacteroidota bacterium]
MKRKVFLLLLGLVIGLSASQSMAQLRFGGGINFGSYYHLGIDIRGEYNLTDDLILAPKVDIGPSFKYGFSYLTEICAHVHYLVYKEDVIAVYPLAGLTLKNYFDLDTSPFDVDLNFGFGFSFGGGVQFEFTDTMTAFGEARYTTGNYHQGMLTAGIIYTPETREQ